MLPFGLAGIDSRPRLAVSYEQAIVRIDSLRADDSPAIAAECGTQLLMHGLGDSITVAGLSLGGVMIAWAAQEGADIDRAVGIER